MNKSNINNHHNNEEKNDNINRENILYFKKIIKPSNDERTKHSEY